MVLPDNAPGKLSTNDKGCVSKTADKVYCLREGGNSISNLTSDTYINDYNLDDYKYIGLYLEWNYSIEMASYSERLCFFDPNNSLNIQGGTNHGLEDVPGEIDQFNCYSGSITINVNNGFVENKIKLSHGNTSGASMNYFLITDYCEINRGKKYYYHDNYLECKDCTCSDFNNVTEVEY